MDVKIMVVDDAVFMRTLIRRILEGARIYTDPGSAGWRDGSLYVPGIFTGSCASRHHNAWKIRD